MNEDGVQLLDVACWVNQENEALRPLEADSPPYHCFCFLHKSHIS